MEHGLADAPAWLAAIEASALAQTLRNSLWLYPVIETLHILGFTTLVGSIIAYDLRVVSGHGELNLPVWNRLVLPVAQAGFLLALPMGLLLFSVEATAYAANPSFRLKMILLVAALGNVLLYHWLARGGAMRPSPGLRVLAAASLLLWVGVLVCGRMIAYV